MDEKNIQLGQSLLETLYNSKALNKENNSELPILLEQTPNSLVELLKKHSLKIGIGIFQSVLTSSNNHKGEFTKSDDDLYDGPALFEKYSDDFQWISDWAMWVKGDPITERFKKLENYPTGGDDKSKIGVALLYKQKDEEGHPVLIIGGAISTEHNGTWEGGRTNTNNFLLIKFDSEASMDRMISNFNMTARESENGTADNAIVLSSIIATMTEDPEIIERMKRRMFRRLEILDVVDTRNLPRHIVQW